MIDSTDKYIDSRDVEESIREAQAAIPEEAHLYRDEYVLEKEELEELDKFNRDGINTFGAEEWGYGVTLIHDAYFEEYAEEMAYDIGAIDREATWPLNRIDWEAAANDLKIDYTSIEFRGETFWGRA